jgi:hypothetical protein
VRHVAEAPGGIIVGVRDGVRSRAVRDRGSRQLIERVVTEGLGDVVDEIGAAADVADGVVAKASDRIA